VQGVLVGLIAFTFLQLESQSFLNSSDDVWRFIIIFELLQEFRIKFSFLHQTQVQLLLILPLLPLVQSTVEESGYCLVAEQDSVGVERIIFQALGIQQQQFQGWV